jgi:hypothetical protein
VIRSVAWLKSLCRQRAVEHVAHDLHVAVSVRGEAGAGCNAVLVDHAQVAEPHVLRVVIVGERKRVVALEPAMIGVATVRRFANADHAKCLI